MLATGFYSPILVRQKFLICVNYGAGDMNMQKILEQQRNLPTWNVISENSEVTLEISLAQSYIVSEWV